MAKSSSAPSLTTGLTSDQVETRIKNGQVNTPPKPLTRSIKRIIIDNTFTWFNLLNLFIAGIIIYTGSYKNLLFLLVAFVNTAIGIIQEIRSKRQVDQMAILNQNRVDVLRNGSHQAIPIEDIVLDDVVFLKRGDQIVADGIVRQTSGVEVDESQLTGESKPIAKQINDPLMSGSFIVSGRLIMQVTAVGHDSFAAKLTHAAKQEKKTASILLDTINQIIKFLTFIIVPLGGALFASKILHHTSINMAILGTSAAVIGMIPEGLVLLTSVALAVGARNLAQHHVLVRTLSAIEALARVDVIALDKTGTLTTGRLKVKQALPQTSKIDATQLQQIASNVVFALDDDNETALAIKRNNPTPEKWQMKYGIAFSSARKWSGVTFEEFGSYLIGAPEYLLTDQYAQYDNELSDYAAQGYRIIAIAHSDEDLNSQELPKDVSLLGFLLIEDELRPTSAKTLEYFRTQDVAIKLISGDNPKTVVQIAKQAGLGDHLAFIDMSQVKDGTDYQQLVKDYQIFGRVSPTQKRDLIKAYQNDGHTVAMTGDGVNDILALRQADCSIAMATGSEATKSIANFVLLDSDFDAMIHVLNEGRRVINNIERVASLFLIKTTYSVVLSILFIFIQSNYPFQPIQLTPINALTVGIPSFFLALEPNYDRINHSFSQNIFKTAFPAGFGIVILILAVQFIGSLVGLSYTQTSTLSVLMVAVMSFSALINIARPYSGWKVGMISCLILLFILVLTVFRQFFSLVWIFTWPLAKVYIPLLIIAYPLFIGLQKLFKILFKNSKLFQ